MSHKPFPDHQLRTLCQTGLCLPVSRIYPLDLHHLHLHDASLFHSDLSNRVQNALTIPVSFPIVLLHIPDSGILPHIKPVNSVMLGILIPAVVNTAAGYNHHITVLSDVEIIVNHILHAALTQHHRNMHALILGPRPDTDIDPADLCLGCNINICCGIPACHPAIGADIVSSLRNSMEICDLLENSLPNLVCHLLSPP